MCGQTDVATAVMEKRTDVPFDVRVVRCGACGHRYLARWPETLTLGLYDYYAAKLDWPEERLFDPLNAARFRALFASFEKLVAGRRLLDLGCGAGHLVKVASEEGWDSLGIDTSAAAVALAQRMRANAQEIDFFDPALDDQRFDVIVMCEVIEHVPHPPRFLARAFSLLAPGGLLYATTPNFDSLTRRVVGADWSAIHPEHISYFVTDTLVGAVRDAGFTVEQISSRNTSPAPIVRALGQRMRPATDTLEAGPAQVSPPDDVPNPGQHWRRVIRSSKPLTALLDATNAVLRMARVGDTLEVWAIRPRREA